MDRYSVYGLFRTEERRNENFHATVFQLEMCLPLRTVALRCVLKVTPSLQGRDKELSVQGGQRRQVTTHYEE